MKNVDEPTIDGFGEEWTWYDQGSLADAERARLFETYFRIFPWDHLPPDAEGFDAGCGSGRWARSVAGRVGRLHCVDASAAALAVARRNLASFSNCYFYHASIDEMPFADGTMDFGYSLGVLHHVPDTAAGLGACVRKLKPGAPFLVYLYYALDNRPLWFRLLWHASDLMRRGISRLPGVIRLWVSQAIALVAYWPLARLALYLERVGGSVGNFPLAAYRNASFYTMRTDALDRFGTRLEKRFTKAEIGDMMSAAGLDQMRFSDHPPFWCAIGMRRG